MKIFSPHHSVSRQLSRLLGAFTRRRNNRASRGGGLFIVREVAAKKERQKTKKNKNEISKKQNF
mgnify:CR=1 FL=1